jgi:hypothetical protein
MSEFTESERYLLLIALGNDLETMTQLHAELTEEKALRVAMRRLEELNAVVDKLGGAPDCPIFGTDVPARRWRAEGSLPTSSQEQETR